MVYDNETSFYDGGWHESYSVERVGYFKNAGKLNCRGIVNVMLTMFLELLKQEHVALCIQKIEYVVKIGVELMWNICF